MNVIYLINMWSKVIFEGNSVGNYWQSRLNQFNICFKAVWFDCILYPVVYTNRQCKFDKKNDKLLIKNIRVKAMYNFQ